MLKEMKGLEYTLEILRVLHRIGEPCGAKEIHDSLNINASLSYVQKILPRMIRAGLVVAAGKGYTLTRPLGEITVDMVLDICDSPIEDAPLFRLCQHLKRATSMTNISEIYNFDEDPG